MLWSQRRATLIAEGRWYQDRQQPADQWRYPHFLTLTLERDLPLVVQARQETGAPLLISEETFADQPGWVALYQSAPGDITAWWQRWSAGASHCKRQGDESLQRSLKNSDLS